MASREPLLKTIPISELRPTQMTVGYREVAEKRRRWREHDPAKKADPERWLPIRDRSSYRPKGKKGKQRAAALTQGGPVSEKVETESPAQQKTSGSNAKKTKKKGKKNNTVLEDRKQSGCKYI